MTRTVTGAALASTVIFSRHLVAHAQEFVEQPSRIPVVHLSCSQTPDKPDADH